MVEIKSSRFGAQSINNYMIIIPGLILLLFVGELSLLLLLLLLLLDLTF